MNILRVCSYYLPAFIYGGPVRSIHFHSKALLHNNCSISIFTTNANGNYSLDVSTAQTLLVDGLSVTYFPRWWWRGKKPFSLFFSPGLGKALQQIKEGDYDLILVNAAFGDPGRMAAEAARRTHTPYMYYTHGSFEPWAFKHKHWKKIIYLELIERRILNRAAGIVVCNQAEIEQLRRLKIGSPIKCIPWGVDLPEFENLPSRKRLEELFPVLKDRPFCLFLSRLHPKKGLDLLIRAYREIAQEFPDWILVLAGPDEGGHRAQVELMVRNLGLKTRVIFTGMVIGEAKEALLAHADLFVLPSYSEGFPMVVAEALGHGRPMVITTSSHVPEVGEGGAGLVVPPERATLTIALREMLGDVNLRKQCARQALEVARRHFTWESVTKKSLAFYHEVI